MLAKGGMGVLQHPSKDLGSMQCPHPTFVSQNRYGQSILFFFHVEIVLVVGKLPAWEKDKYSLNVEQIQIHWRVNILDPNFTS